MYTRLNTKMIVMIGKDEKCCVFYLFCEVIHINLVTRNLFQKLTYVLFLGINDLS